MASISSNANDSVVICHRNALSRQSAKAKAASIAASASSHNRFPLSGAGGSTRVFGAASDAAVVVTVTVTLLPAAAGLGEIVHVASEGAPVQVNVMAPENPPMPPRLIV